MEVLDYFRNTCSTLYSGVILLCSDYFSTMAPEVVLNKPYNHKADVYSYTIILYHMLTGRHPIGPEMNRSVTKQYVSKGNWRPRIYPYWPTKLYQLIVRGWSAEVRVRPNFIDILHDLKIVNEMNVNFDEPPVGGTTYGLLQFVE